MARPEPDGLPPERLPRRLETARFYVDEDLLPVGNAMMWTRTDVIVCGARLIADELPLGTRTWTGSRSWPRTTGS